MKRLLATTTFFFVLFPYLSPIGTPFDTQPYALLSALLLLLATISSGTLRAPSAFWVLLQFLAVPAAYAIEAMAEAPLASVRAFARYVTPVALMWAGYLSASIIRSHIFGLAVWIWLVFGVLDWLFKTGSISIDLSALVTSASRTDASRGVTSLAVEPSYYAIACYYMLILNELFFRRRQYGSKRYLVFSAALCAQMLFLSQSGFSVVLVAIWLLYKTVISLRKAKELLYVATAAPLIALSIWGILRNTRAGRLVQLAMNEGVIGAIWRDTSIAQRVQHIGVALQGFYSSFPYGNGFAHEDPIMSGIGTVLFELGLFGMVFLGLLLWSAVPKERRFVPLMVLCMLPLVTSVPTTLPAPFYIAGLLKSSTKRWRCDIVTTGTQTHRC